LGRSFFLIVPAVRNGRKQKKGTSFFEFKTSAKVFQRSSHTQYREGRSARIGYAVDQRIANFAAPDAGTLVERYHISPLTLGHLGDRQLTQLATFDWMLAPISLGASLPVLLASNSA
jgi:hypothetical protein